MKPPSMKGLLADEQVNPSEVMNGVLEVKPARPGGHGGVHLVYGPDGYDYVRLTSKGCLQLIALLSAALVEE